MLSSDGLRWDAPVTKRRDLPKKEKGRGARGGGGKTAEMMGGGTQSAGGSQCRGGAGPGGGEPAAALKSPLPVGVTAGQGASSAGGWPGLLRGSGPRHRAPPGQRGEQDRGDTHTRHTDARLAAWLCPPVNLATGWGWRGTGAAVGMSPRWHLGWAR